MADDGPDARARDARALLRAAWDDMLAELARARDAIDDPALMPPPANDRNLAEGYRYLMGFLYGAIERAFFENPRFPYFRNAIQVVDKATIDNADAIYFAARIDGREATRVTGRAQDHRHWRGATPARSGRKAPQYLIFECTAGELTGDSGSLAELQPGLRARTGWIDCTQLEVEKDGSFELLLAPERPPGHAGNFVPTKTKTRRPGPDGGSERFATYVSGRQLFYDWEREDAVELQIAQQGAVGAHPAPLDPSAAAASLRRLGSLARGQMHFWNEFYTVLLETYGKRDGSEGERFMPRNAFNEPNAASGATGGGMGTNIYAGGVFELEPDEALVIESRVSLPPQYIGFHLSNLWGESRDYANCISSLNGFQSEVDPDGAIRYVVAHRDPGVPNWVDTTGHREGFMAPRWAYTETPPRESWPTIGATKVRFDEIRAQLPPGTRSISPEERREQVRIRQEHVQRRFRAF
jgi:hypothetical protein